MDYLHLERQVLDRTTVTPTGLFPQFGAVRSPLSDTFVSRQKKDGFDAMPLQIGHYRILDQIGKGGMGTIYRVEHVFLKRNFAMKVINSKLLGDPRIAGYFSMETLLMGSLQHPNIVQTTDAGNDDGRLFIVMELLHGNDLTKHVEEHGPLPVSLALEYLKQAAQGLAAAHSEGIIHRDVKPSNLFLTEDGVIKLLDLGVAKNVGIESDRSCTHELGANRPSGSGLIGSPGFMAPEQILESRSDARSDIYSLGCTFYFMLTGRLPFDAPEYPDVKSILDAHVEKEIPSLMIYRDDLNDRTDDFVRKMTDKNPSRRFQTMKQLATVIEKPAAHISTRKKTDRPAKRRRFTPVTGGFSASRLRNRPALQGFSKFVSGIFNRIQPSLAVSAMILMLFAFGLSFAHPGNELFGLCSEQACNEPCMKPASCPVQEECTPQKCGTDTDNDACSGFLGMLCCNYSDRSRCASN